ncbi:hypothetical protein BsWGS_21200 [Bradybaena similaris]
MNREEPEYLDSFCAALPLASNGPSQRDRNNPRTLTFSEERNYLLSSDFYIKYRRNRLINLPEGTFNNERCECCNEVLHRVHLSALVVSDLALQYSSCIVSKSQQPPLLPHYCTFVGIKTLHERGNGSSRDAGQQGKELLSHNRISLLTSRTSRRVHRNKTLTGVSALDALVTSERDMPGVYSSQPSTIPFISSSQFEPSVGAFNEGVLSDQAIQIGATTEDIPSACTTQLQLQDNGKPGSPDNETLGDGQDELSDSDKGGPFSCVEACLWQQQRQDGLADERTRASHAQEQPLQISPEPDLIPTAVESPETKLSVAWIPELPNVNAAAFDNHRTGNRAARRQLSAPQQLEKQLKFQRTNEQVFTFYEFGDLDSTSRKANDAITEAQKPEDPSQKITRIKSIRFELPMDLKALETLSAQEYVKNYCRMLSLHEKLCLGIFNKYKGKNCAIQGKSTLFDALNEVLSGIISREHRQRLCELLQIDDCTVVNFRLFAGITAVLERLAFTELCSKDEAEDNFQKDSIESADFYSLDWKLREIQIKKDMRVLLHLLL